MNNGEKKPSEKEATTKENEYTPEEVPFADGEGTKLDEEIDEDELGVGSSESKS